MTVVAIVCIIGALAIAVANGANDNGKGVATLVGGQVLRRREALWLGHVATLAGALLSIYVARGLVHTFQGDGLLSADAVGQTHILATIALAAAATVALATYRGIPVSTTHALAGALVGTGLGTAGTISWNGLLGKFVIPLLLSPVVSAVLAAVAYAVLHRCRLALNVTEETCLCAGDDQALVPPDQRVPASSLTDWSAGPTQAVGSAIAHPHMGVAIGTQTQCRRRYGGTVKGVSAAALLDGMHILSGTMISAARGLNDAPKLAAMAVGIASWSTAGPAVALVALAMFVGGILAAKRVAQTMSHDITYMNAGSAATANFISTALVICASVWVMPVSTTHVTCGALIGIGAMQGQAHWRTIGGILVAWVATLPVAAAVAFALSLAL